MQTIPNEILIKASTGDTEAFEKIYKTTSGFVYNVALRITNNKEEAEEVTQDVFLKVYRNLRNFRFRCAIKTWIYRIAVNEAINTSKKRARHVKRSVEYDEDISHKPVSERLRERPDQEENEALVQRLLSMLSPKLRTCVILRDIQGLSYKEMADTLRVNINTVRSRLKRAREALLSAAGKGR